MFGVKRCTEQASADTFVIASRVPTDEAFGNLLYGDDSNAKTSSRRFDCMAAGCGCSFPDFIGGQGKPTRAPETQSRRYSARFQAPVFRWKRLEGHYAEPIPR